MSAMQNAFTFAKKPAPGPAFIFTSMPTCLCFATMAPASAMTT